MTDCGVRCLQVGGGLQEEHHAGNAISIPPCSPPRSAGFGFGQNWPPCLCWPNTPVFWFGYGLLSPLCVCVVCHYSCVNMCVTLCVLCLHIMCCPFMLINEENYLDFFPLFFLWFFPPFFHSIVVFVYFLWRSYVVVKDVTYIRSARYSALPPAMFDSSVLAVPRCRTLLCPAFIVQQSLYGDTELGPHFHPN